MSSDSDAASDSTVVLLKPKHRIRMYLSMWYTMSDSMHRFLTLVAQGVIFGQRIHPNSQH